MAAFSSAALSASIERERTLVRLRRLEDASLSSPLERETAEAIRLAKVGLKTEEASIERQTSQAEKLKKVELWAKKKADAEIAKKKKIDDKAAADKAKHDILQRSLKTKRERERKAMRKETEIFEVACARKASETNKKYKRTLTALLAGGPPQPPMFLSVAADAAYKKDLETFRAQEINLRKKISDSDATLESKQKAAAMKVEALKAEAAEAERIESERTMQSLLDSTREVEKRELYAMRKAESTQRAFDKACERAAAEQRELMEREAATIQSLLAEGLAMQELLTVGASDRHLLWKPCIAITFKFKTKLKQSLRGHAYQKQNKCDATAYNMSGKAKAAATAKTAEIPKTTIRRGHNACVVFCLHCQHSHLV